MMVFKYLAYLATFFLLACPSQKAKTPYFVINGVEYSSGSVVNESQVTFVHIKSDTEDARLMYTLDSSTPSSTHGTRYNDFYNGNICENNSQICYDPVQVYDTVTIKAIAAQNNFDDSSVATIQININVGQSRVKAPILNPGSGVFSSTFQVIVTNSTQGAEMRYTVGSNPPTPTPSSGTLITNGGTISINSPGVVYVMVVAYKDGMADSMVSSSKYTLLGSQVDTPVITPASGKYESSRTITISTITPDAEIYYTLDGSSPTITNSNRLRYTHSFRLPRNVNDESKITLKAIAEKNDKVPSNISTAKFTFLRWVGVGGNGDVRSSIDGGLSWHPLSSGITDHISSIATDTKGTWIMAAHEYGPINQLFYSDTAGFSWSNLGPAVNGIFIEELVSDIYGTIFIGVGSMNSKGMIRYAWSPGITWQNLYDISNDPLYAIDTDNLGRYVVSGEQGKIFWSVDPTKKWNAASFQGNSSSYNTFTTVKYIGENEEQQKVWLAAGGHDGLDYGSGSAAQRGIIFRSLDNGATWSKVPNINTSIGSWFTQIASNKRGYAIAAGRVPWVGYGDNTLARITTDFGDTWYDISPSDTIYGSVTNESIIDIKYDGFNRFIATLADGFVLLWDIDSPSWSWTKRPTGSLSALRSIAIGVK